MPEVQPSQTAISKLVNAECQTEGTVESLEQQVTPKTLQILMKSVQEEDKEESAVLRNDSEVVKIKIPRSSSQIELHLTNQKT